MLRQPPDHLGSSPLDGDFPPNPYSDLPEDMTLLGRTITIKGELTAAEHLIIEGHFEGQLAIPDHGLAIGKHAVVTANVLAKTVTILGTSKGTFTAADKVEIRATGSVKGRIVTLRIAIDEGAYFEGSIDQKRTEAAVAVGRHRLKQRTAASADRATSTSS